MPNPLELLGQFGAKVTENPLLLNLLAQQGYSRMPQSRFAALGRAGLATNQQQQEQQTRGLQEQLLRARLGLVNKQLQAQDSPLAGIPDSVLGQFDPNSVVRALQTRNIGALEAAGPDADKIQDRVNELADDVRAESKDYQLQSEAFGRIRASAEDASPAGDLALIFNYMKVLDPGSTVREGEFANAQNSGSVPTKLQQVYNSILRGTRLTDAQRADFLNRAGRLYNSAIEGQQRRNTRFRQRGINAKIPEFMLDPILPETRPVDLSPFDPASLEDDVVVGNGPVGEI